MAKQVDPDVSDYFRKLALKRKNPYLPFKDKKLAKKMSLKAMEAKRLKRDREIMQDVPQADKTDQTEKHNRL